MRNSDAQLGRPEILYKDTKTNIEALASPVVGMKAYATDTNEEGVYKASGWSWTAVVVLEDHDHSGDTGDGGQFDVENLTDQSTEAGQVLTSDGEGGHAFATPSGGGHTIQEEGSDLPQRSKLNFIGSAVTAEDDAANNATKVTITGGSDGNILSVTKESHQIRKVLYDNTLQSAGTWDVQNIDQTYDHLELILYARGTPTGSPGVDMQFNGDTTATNYRVQRFYGATAVHSSDAVDSYYGGVVPGSDQLANSFASIHSFISNYRSNTNKVTIIKAGYRIASADSLVDAWSCFWESNNAINRIVIACSGSTFVAGSRLQIIGIKETDVVTDVEGSGDGGAVVVEKKTIQTRTTLYDNALAADGSGWDVQNIDQSYDHLEITLWGRGTQAATYTLVKIAFNNDTTEANYRYIEHDSSSEAHSVGESDTRNYSYVSAANAPADDIGQSVGYIKFYSKTTRKKMTSVRSDFRYADTKLYQIFASLDWENTSAINRIALTINAGNFLAGSRLQIIGVKDEEVVTDITGMAEIKEDIGANVYNSTNQSLTPGQYTTLTFDTEAYDTDSIHDGTNPTRLTCKTAGKYLIVGHIAIAADTSTACNEFGIWKNASTILVRSQRPTNSESSMETISIIADLAVNDYVELKIWKQGNTRDALLGFGKTGFMMQRIDAFVQTSGESANPSIINGRLTLESGVPVSTSDQTAKTTLYYTPYNGNQIALYNGNNWSIMKFVELSIAIPSSTNTNYDVFAYDNGGTVTLELTAWTNDTTRATALVRQDGILCKSGSLTRRYLGTIRTTGTSGQCEDSLSCRFVWNYSNQELRRFSKSVFSEHTFNSSWRYWNNSSTHNIKFVVGLEVPVTLTVSNYVESGSGMYVCINESVAENTSFMSGSPTNPSWQWETRTGTIQAVVGYHIYYMLEAGNGTTAMCQIEGANPF